MPPAVAERKLAEAQRELRPPYPNPYILTL
jgi:hypothetical protein